MKYCPECSARCDDAQPVCLLCKFSFLSLELVESDRQHLPFALSRELPAWRGGTPVVATTNPTVAKKSFAKILLGSSEGVTGRVIAADNSEREDADWDVFLFLTRSLWFALFILSPILVIWWLLVMAGGFSAILALVVFVCLLRFIAPGNLFSLVHLAVLLNPFRRCERNGVPVRYLRVRDQQEGDEFIVRLKGQYAAADLRADDLVSFQGKWRDGVLHATRAYNDRPKAYVRIRESWSWLWFCLTLVAIGCLILAFREPIAVVAQKIETLQTP